MVKVKRNIQLFDCPDEHSLTLPVPLRWPHNCQLPNWRVAVWGTQLMYDLPTSHN